MLFNEESLRNLISLSHLNRLISLSKEQMILLQSAIGKIKYDQLLNASSYLKNMFNDPEFPRDKDKLREILLYSASPEKLVEIYFNNNHPVETTFTKLHKFQYNFFLDKPYSDHVKKKKSAISNKLLRFKNYRGMPRVSCYFSQNNNFLAPEEQKILNEVYPLNKLIIRKFWQEAHEDIRLTIEEIQTVAINFIETIISHDFMPITDIKIKPLPAPYNNNLKLYTNQPYFTFIDNDDMRGLQEYFAIHGFDPFIINYHKNLSLLSYAVRLQRANIVKYLLSLGTEINSFDQETDFSALHYATEGADLEIFRQIVAASSDLNIGNKQNCTPLHIATYLNKPEFVELLIQAGADPNKQMTYTMKTALHFAVTNQCIPVIKILLTCKKIDISLMDSQMKTASELSTSDEINSLLSQFSSTENVNRPIAKKDHARMIQFSHLPENIANLANMLLEPRVHKISLLKVDPKLLSLPNPFLNIPISEDNFNENNKLYINFFDQMKDQLAYETRIRNKFLDIVARIDQFSKEDSDGGQIYLQILEICQEIRREQFQFIAVAFEIWRKGFLNQLINLVDRKTPMQVAIECDDPVAVEKILTSAPPTEPEYLLTNNKKKMTELDYAIHNGKSKAVQAFITAATQNPAINLGYIPPNATMLAESRKEALTEFTPACIEVEYFYAIRPPDESPKNWKRVLRSLRNTLPPSKLEPVNGFFTQQEYPLVRLLLAEKEQTETPIGKKIWQKFLERIRARRLIEKRREAAKKLYIEKEEQEAIELSLEYFKKETVSDMIQKIRKRHINFSIPLGHPFIENLYHHSTNHRDLILRSGQLKMVAHVLSTGEIKVASTPLGSRFNNFFSPGGPKADLTNLRCNDAHIVKLNVTKAVKEGLLEPKDIYASPHIPAYSIFRVETPIIFIGENPKIQTIYRLYHISTKDKKNYKVHWFDYRFEGKPYGSYVEKLEMKEEFFQGENIKSRAYRLIDFLRKLKGPFNEGTYYHYVLNNLNNIAIVESAIAAIFNVYNVEGKICKNIDIHHPAVSIVENEQAKQSALLTAKLKYQIIELIQGNDQPDELAKLIENSKLSYSDLGFAVQVAASHQKDKMVHHLLIKGAPAFSRTETALNEGIKRLEKAYLKSNDLASDELQTALRIIKWLLYLGNSSKHDPAHIRYAASPDNLGEVPGGHAWRDKSINDLLVLKKFLCFFREFSVQVVLLSAITKHLPTLYHFTYSMNLVDAHRFIASRLKVSPLIDSEKNQELKNKVTQREAIDYTKLSQQQLVFLFNYAIQTGISAVVLQFYPIYKKFMREELGKTLANEFCFNPLFSALKFNQIKIFERLLTINQETSLSCLTDISLFAYLWDQKEAIKLLIDQGVKVNSEYLLKAVTEGEVDDIDYLAQGMSEKIIKTSKPIMAAIKMQNLKSVTILLNRYLEIVGNQKKTCQQLISSATAFAANNNSSEIFKFLLEKLVKLIRGKNAVNILNALFNEIIVNINLKDLIFFVEKINALSLKDKSNIFIINFVDHEDCRFIQVIANNNIDKLKLLRKLLPDIIFRNQTEPRFSCYTESGSILWKVLLNKITIKTLDFLLEDKYIIDKLAEKISILGQAIISGRLDIVQWSLAKLISATYHDEKDNNILHLLAHHFSYVYHQNLEADLSKIKQCIDYICIEQEIDTNHRNKQGDTVFFAKSSSHRDYTFITDTISVFFTHIASYDKTNLTLNNGITTILHSSFITPWIVDKYIDQGGNINAEDQHLHYTPLEALLVCKNLDKNLTAVKDKLLQLSHPPRNLLPENYPVSQMAFTSVTIDGKHYLLIANNSIFCDEKTFRNRKIFSHVSRYHIAETQNSDEVISYHYLVHIHLGVKQTTIKRFTSELKKQSPKFDWRLTELSSLDNLTENSSGIYQSAEAFNDLLISCFFKNILELIKEHLMIFLNQPSIPSAYGKHFLTTKSYNLFLSFEKEFRKNLISIYSQIAADNSKIDNPDYAMVTTEAICFNCFIQSHDGYQKYQFHSAMSACINLSKIEIAKQLLERAIALRLATPVATKDISLAIKLEKIDFLKLFLQPKYVNANQVAQVATSLKKENLEIVDLLVNFLVSVKANKTIIKKFKKGLAVFFEPEEESQNQKYQAILLKLNSENKQQTRRNSQPATNSSTANIASRLQNKKREKPKQTGVPTAKREKPDEQAVASSNGHTNPPTYPSPLSNRPTKHTLSPTAQQTKKQEPPSKKFRNN
jgi:ankyrin repeat protein